MTFIVTASMGKVAGEIQQWPHGLQAKCSWETKSRSQGTNRDRVPGEIEGLEEQRGVEDKPKFEKLHDKDMAPTTQGALAKNTFPLISFCHKLICFFFPYRNWYGRLGKTGF